jgi:hypothetical protein
LIFSCHKEENPSIVIGEKEITISNEGTSQIISFDANVNWTGRSSANWCTLSQTNDEASTKRLEAMIAPNDT